MRIDINYILECLEEEKYDKAIKYLDNIKIYDETRLGNQLIKIIVTMNYINGSNKYEYPNVKYENSKQKTLTRFFEALRHKDYIEASNLVDNCIMHLKRQHTDYKEMEIYKKVLVYAVDVQQRALIRSNDLITMNKLNNEIITYVKNNNKVKEEDLYWLFDSLDDIINISANFGKSPVKMQYALEIVQIILDFSDGVYRDKNYFGNVSEYTNNNTLSKLYTRLSNGQYTSAYNSVKKYILNSNKNVEWIYKLYYMLLDYLDKILNNYEHKESLNENYVVCNQDINYDKLFNETLKNKNENDVELLANLVLAKVLNKNKML